MLPLVVVQIEKVLCRKIKLARSRKRQARQKKHYLSVFQTHRRILIQKNRPILRRKSQTIRVRAVMRSNRMVVLVAQKSSDIEQAGPRDIFNTGTVSRVVRMIRMPDGNIQIYVQGLERVEIGEFTQEKPYLAAHVTVRPDVEEEDKETEAIKRNVISYFQRLITLVQYMPEGVAAHALNL